jgi:1-acyl-sn-glycerol-3-phosphate acyltransferase
MPILGLSGAVLAIVAISLTFVTTPKVASMVGGITWARISSFFTPIWVSVKGMENIDRKQSYVVVTNHQSHYDIFVVYGWLWMDIKWVMKKDLRKTPFIGYACERVGHIIIDRSDSQKAIESINKAKKNIVNGTSIIFFPEGTRSKDGKIGAFKKGAFKIAIDLQLPILPITINGTRKILPSNSMNLLPGCAEMIVHPPISISAYTDRNLEELMDKTRTVIISAFRQTE